MRRLFETLSDDVVALLPHLTKIRHDIHAHPELGFEEFRTQKLVREWLTQWGYEVRDCAETGLIADLKPGLPEIALRADLDCLPMQERTDLPYRSTYEGRAHKCGHDGHTSILMGVAKILATHREKISGNVRLLFQPAEEGVRGGGAKVMIAEGALEGVEEVYGLHNWPGFDKGHVRVKPGPLMAQVHSFDLKIHGKGGHGSQPQLCVDPIVAGAALVNSLQTIVSRGLGYEGGAVVSICAFHAGTTDNVTPRTAELKGTIRTFEPKVTERVLRRFEEIREGIQVAYGVSMELVWRVGYPVLMNDDACTERVRRVGEKVVGSENVSDQGLPMAGSEDFAYFSLEKPSAYFFLGAKRLGEETPICHHPDFDFDDDLIPIGVRMFLGIVADRFSVAGSTIPE